MGIFGSSAAEEASKVKAGDDYIIQKVRLGEQAALMLNADNLIENPASGDTAPIRDKQFSNFCKFTGSAGGHIGLTNQLYRNESTEYLFKNLPSHILSSLLPSVKLYKVFYPSENNTTGYSWRIPFDNVAVKYNGVTSKYVETTLEDLLAGRSRGNAVGIKSFFYKFVGTNPAEVNTNIESELELYFQDVRDLVKRIEFDEKDPNFTSGTPDKNPKGGFSFAYSDLVVDNPRQIREDPSKKLEYNDKYFRLKVVCGYSLPNEEILNTLPDAATIENVKAAINSAKVVLYLTPYRHDINFEETGAVTLKIQYIAAMTSILANIDILAITNEHDKLLQLEREFNELAYAENLAIDEIKNNCSFSQEDRQKKVDDKQKELENKLAAQKYKLETDKNYLYSSIFRRFLGLSESSVTAVNPKVYSVLVNGYAVGARTAFGNDRVLENPTQRRIIAAAEARQTDDFKVYSGTAGVKDLPLSTLSRTYSDDVEALRRSIPLIGDVSQEEASKVREKAIETINSEQSKAFQESGSGIYEVKFVFLGDLLDVVLDETIGIANDSERPRIILSDFQFEIPTNPMGDLVKKTSSESIDDTLERLNNPNITDAAYMKYTTNLANIPISLNMLQNLLFEKLVKTGRTRYPLVTFLNDVITEVIAPAIAPSVFGKKTTFNKAVRMSMLPISMPFVKSGNNFIDPITQRRSNARFFGITDEAKLKSLKIHNNSIINFDSNIGNYLIIYCSNQLPENIIKNGALSEVDRYKKDVENGVYHFYIGSDKGIIKKINFSRTDAQFYKEARAQNSAGDQNLGRLREVYDANISMFGNNMFRPGDFIYIEPLFFVGAAALDLQNKLGLGGYYQVIDIDTKFNENIFETNMRCVLAGYIEDGKVKSTESTRSCN